MLLISLIFRKKVTLSNFWIFKKLSRKEKTNLILVNALSGALLGINWYLFIYVMNHVSVNATALAYMLCPIITTFLAFLFLKERLSLIQWIAISVSIFSCVLLSIGHLLDVFYSFIIAASYAVYLVLQKKNQLLDRFFTLAFQVLVGTILLLPLFSMQSEVPEKGFYFYGIVFLIATVFTIIPMFLNVFSLNKLSSSTAGIFIYLNPILSFLLAVFYFKEEMEPVKIIAYLVVFFSVLLFNSKPVLQLIRRK